MLRWQQAALPGQIPGGPRWPEGCRCGRCCSRGLLFISAGLVYQLRDAPNASAHHAVGYVGVLGHICAGVH